MQKKITDIIGVILAGGQSSRIGSDKALLIYRDKAFIQLITDELKNVFKEVIVISDHGKEYKFLGLPIYEDIYKNKGPLAGIHAALTITKKDIFVVSCDLPLVNEDLILSLLKASSSQEIAAFSVNGLIQPLFGIYKFSCVKKLESDLEAGKLSVHKFIRDCQSQIFDAENFLFKNVSPLLRNINSFEQYQTLLREFK
jgi:molybdenum cofactor guanylyltransferase